MEPSLDWAQEEFGHADLGDARRTARLVQLASALGTRPSMSIPEASGSMACTKAAYRFFANQDIRSQAIMESHVASSIVRMREVDTVLAVQDTTSLNWSQYPSTTGLGPIDDHHTQGLMVHTTLAMTPEHVPLGVLEQQVWARSETYHHQDHGKRVLAQKESQKWLTSLNAVIALREQCPQTNFVSVGDREADVYDLFLAPRPKGVDLLVRAAQDRKTTHESVYLWAAMESLPVAATMVVHMGARGDLPAREASLEIRYQPISLQRPRKRSMKLPCVDVWAVWAVEPHPPQGIAAVEWMLLSTLPVETLQDAQQRLSWYAARWGIEVWHKVLKSGCQIERRQLEAADRLERCLALYSVIAWRILYATMLARAAPNVLCTILLEREEWQGLYCRIHRVPVPPQEPPTLQQAVRWIAQLGGFLGRKGDGEPGVNVIWKGFQHLIDIAAMFKIFNQNCG